MKKVIISAAFAVLASACSTAQKIDADKLKEHIKTLTGDGYEGRGTGAPGEAKANEYIEKQFTKIGLVPRGETGYDQSFPFKSTAHGEGTPGTAQNLSGNLDNGATSTIIISAHY